MKLNKKLFISTLLSALVVVVAIISLNTSAFPVPEAKASTSPNPSPHTGWGWSSNIGWINNNPANPGSGGGTYAPVAVQANGIDIAGWAWSPNIGWIKFGGLSGYPTTGAPQVDAKISGNYVIGWARACAGTVKAGDPYLLQNDYPIHMPTLTGDCSTMTDRPDGWDGWIEMTGSHHQLTYDSVTGNINGYVWGGPVVGWIDMNISSTVAPPVVPTTPTVQTFCTRCSNPPTAPPPPPVVDCYESGQVYSVLIVTNPQAGLNYQYQSIGNGLENVGPADFPTINAYGQPQAKVIWHSPGTKTLRARAVDPNDASNVSPWQQAVPAPSVESCEGSIPSATTDINLTVKDNRYGTVDNPATEAQPLPGIKTTRVVRNKPFDLTTAMDANQFDNYSITVPPADVSGVAQYPSGTSGTNINLVNGTQKMTQSKSEVTYTLVGERLSPYLLLTSRIKVTAVDPNIEEK